MRVRCDYCGIWFAARVDVLATYESHCDRLSSAQCYEAASLAWSERRGGLEECLLALRGADLAQSKG